MRIWAFASLAVQLVAGTPVAATTGRDCDLSQIKWLGELQYRLSRRAVDIVNLAARSRNSVPETLKDMVDPAAEISLGAGDVGRPLGTGTTGLRALALEMNADSFRFLGWDYIPMPIDTPCGKHKAEVEFTDSRRKNVFPVTFEFEAGRMVGAKGWTRSFEAGEVAPVQQ